MEILTIKDLTVHIGRKKICEQLNFTIRQGEIWAILGGNGVGKTTLLHTLAGLHTVSSGEIFLYKQHVKHYSRKQMAKHLGLLLQNQSDNFPMTVFTSALTGRYPHLQKWQRETQEDINITHHILAQMNLADYKNRHLNTLSGGERQRTALATILIQNPDLYLLDEPNNHLDINYQQTIFTYLSNLCEKRHKAIIMALQDINLTQRFCTHVILIYQEGIVKAGSTDELLTEHYLSQLYQQKLVKITSEYGAYWLTV